MDCSSSQDSSARRESDEQTRAQQEKQVSGGKDVVHLYLAEKELTVKSREQVNAPH